MSETVQNWIFHGIEPIVIPDGFLFMFWYTFPLNWVQFDLMGNTEEWGRCTKWELRKCKMDIFLKSLTWSKQRAYCKTKSFVYIHCRLRQV